jgi:hypothetical protein
MGQGKTTTQVYYQKTPGLLGEWGHLGVRIRNQHPDIKFKICAQIVDYQVNTMLDYNPEKNRQLAAIIPQQKQRIALKNAKLNENEQKQTEMNANYQEEELLAIKKSANAYHKKNGQPADVKEMFRQLQEKNGY